MGTKGKPPLDLVPPLERGQSLLETVHTAPDGLLLLISSSGHLGALSLSTGGGPPPLVGQWRCGKKALPA